MAFELAELDTIVPAHDSCHLFVCKWRQLDFTWFGQIKQFAGVCPINKLQRCPLRENNPIDVAKAVLGKRNVCTNAVSHENALRLEILFGPDRQDIIITG